MPHSHAALLVHVIFSTKDRRPLLEQSLCSRLFPYMNATADQYGVLVHVIDGAADHVHLLISVPASRSLAEILRVVKCNSSRWVGEEFPDKTDFGWQTGYAAFSVSSSMHQQVHDYIARQREHHKTRSFQEELITFLKKHGVDYDERYRWG